VFFSGKITNSAIAFLQSRGAERGELYELTDLPVEFLKDPTSWLEAGKVESWFAQIEKVCLVDHGIENPMQTMGHEARELKAWGVLDSVLNMIEKPQDIFMQPQRFISYFISPAPPIANLQRGPHSLSFDLPISFEEYPHVASYLCAAIEAVPTFMGQPMAEASWSQNRLAMSWDVAQSAFGDGQMDRRQMAPEVVQNLISNLEKTERALLEKTQEIERVKAENAMAAQSKPAALEEISHNRLKSTQMLQQVLRLQDYFTRSQQLITLLVGQDRLNAQVKEAMKRVNWELVQSSFPQVTQEILSQLENKNGTNHTNQNARDSR
jgi:hypothetical protein